MVYSKLKHFKPNIFFGLLLLHILGIIGVYIILCSGSWFSLTIHLMILNNIAGFGITGGVHRLWAHRSYKATLPLKIILWVCCCFANQGSLIHWARDHRTHHKGSDTTADPHNVNNGFWFSHIGWLWYTKHPDVIKKSNGLNYDDLNNDAVVWLDRVLYPYPHLIVSYIIPTIYGKYMFDSYAIGFFVLGELRWLIISHITWCVNSIAHTFGDKPYRDIKSSQNLLVSILAVGEGWHNFHHAYPFDYRAAELPWYIQINITTLLLNGFSKIGWAYDLKTVPQHIVEKDKEELLLKKKE